MCNTPFPTYKTYTGGGGRRVTYIVSWPAKVQDRGQSRSQFIHVTDVMPTLLALADLKTLDTIIGGMALNFEEGALRFYYNGFGEHSTLPAVPLAAGDHEAVLDYEATGQRQGRGRLLLDGRDATGWGNLSPTLMVGFHEGLDIGLDRRCPVSWQLYEKHRSFRFTGTIEDVTIEPGERSAD